MLMPMPVPQTSTADRASLAQGLRQRVGERRIVHGLRTVGAEIEHLVPHRLQFGLDRALEVDAGMVGRNGDRFLRHGPKTWEGLGYRGEPAAIRHYIWAGGNTLPPYNHGSCSRPQREARRERKQKTALCR
jgi:hypothetical protein